MEHTLDGIRWCYEYQNGKMIKRWLNCCRQSRTGTTDHCKHFSNVNFLSKNIFYVKRKMVIIAKHLIWRRWFPLQLGIVLLLSFEYCIQSITARQITYRVSPKKCASDFSLSLLAQICYAHEKQKQIWNPHYLSFSWYILFSF